MKCGDDIRALVCCGRDEMLDDIGALVCCSRDENNAVMIFVLWFVAAGMKCGDDFRTLVCCRLTTWLTSADMICLHAV